MKHFRAIFFILLIHCSFDKNPKIFSVLGNLGINSSSFKISGTVSGLGQSDSVELKNNSESLIITQNGNFQFTNLLNPNENYSITISKQPSQKNCEVTNGTGVISGKDIQNVTVVCTATGTISIGGTVANLVGAVVLQNNSSNNLTLSSNGSFTFTTLQSPGSSYSVTILTQPNTYTCFVLNGSGIVSSSNITNININCTANTLVGGSVIGALNLTGEVLTLVGSTFCNPNSTCNGFAVSGFTNNSNPANVEFDEPRGITTDGTFLYVADYDNNRIRKVTIATGATTTLAGNGIFAMTDGTGTAASIQGPNYLTTDGIFVYLTDHNNNAIRKIEINTGIVTTIVSSNPNLLNVRGLIYSNNLLYVLDSNSDSLKSFNLSNNTFTNLTTGSLSSPRSVAIHGNDFYITDDANNGCIFKTTLGVWTLSQFAGCSVQGLMDGTGTSARFNTPTGIVSDGTSLYVADVANNVIRRINPSTAAVTTIAGSTGGTPNYVNSTIATNARFNQPIGIVSDGTALYISDMFNHSIRILR